MNTDEHPEFTSSEGDRMGEYLIPCLQCESVRDQAAHISPQLPPPRLSAHDCRVLKAEGVYMEQFVQVAVVSVLITAR